MDSLNVLLVIPIEYDRNRKVVHAYKRIKVEDLSKKGISDLYLNLNFKQLREVGKFPTMDSLNVSKWRRITSEQSCSISLQGISQVVQSLRHLFKALPACPLYITGLRNLRRKPKSDD